MRPGIGIKILKQNFSKMKERTLDHDEQSSFYVEPSSLELNSHDFNENIDE